jgi:diphosphomevalonate decarboxylase
VSSRATAVAPANIAFIKYWGAHDVERGVPMNPSVSMTLSRCVSICTVEAHPREDGRSGVAPHGEDCDGVGDEILLAGPDGNRPAPEFFACRIRDHLDRLRKLFDAAVTFRVATKNSFPAGAGLASSASGFAALTLAAVRALGLDLATDELSVLARRSGSGSAARSVLGGFVELPGGPDEGDVYARPLAGAADWDLRDVIAVVASEPKSVSSREGHRRVVSSPYYRERLALLPGRLATVRDAIERRDFHLLGPVVEEEGIDLHLVAMSAIPPIFYWLPGTLQVLETVRMLRLEGIEAYSTMDAGPNVHVICRPSEEASVVDRLGRLESVREVICDGVGPGPRFSEDHLL